VSSVGVEGKSSTDRYASLALRYLSGAFEAVLVADTTLYGNARTGNNYTDDNGWTVTLGGNYTFGNGVKVLAFGQGFGDMALNTAARAGVTYDGIYAITDGLGYGFVTGWGAGLGIHVPAGGGVLKGSVGYRDMDNQWDTDFKRIVASVGYDYPLSKRTALYAMGGYSREKVETSTNAEAKPDGYELTVGMVHRF
jgi:predicted porin